MVPFEYVHIREVVAKNILRGQAFSNYDVIRAMTSLLQLFFQNIGGANAPLATPSTTPLVVVNFAETQDGLDSLGAWRRS